MKGVLSRFLAFSLFLFVFCFLFLSGCGPFWVDPYITVKESSLNWVIIHYYKLPKQEGAMSIRPLRRIGVEIYGNGMVLVKKGSSELVSNDFAKHHKEDSWSDIKTSRYQITPGQAQDIFQTLVNAGVLDKEKTFRSSEKKVQDRFISVAANLNCNTYSDNVNIFEEDPDLAEVLLDVVREFENPAR